ncbi:hypothetical protein TNCV_2091021 [Trichonephila clavipes]|nr:hypothetical protein TNCV_2091021 [Trichonephila clavipes]
MNSWDAWDWLTLPSNMVLPAPFGHGSVKVFIVMVSKRNLWRMKILSIIQRATVFSIPSIALVAVLGCDVAKLTVTFMMSSVCLIALMELLSSDVAYQHDSPGILFSNESLYSLW